MILTIIRVNEKALFPGEDWDTEGAGRKGTHVGPVLPERAPSEGPRSTAALRPT